MMPWWQPCSPACLGSFLAVQHTRLQPSRDAPLSLNHCAAFSTNVRGKVIGDLEMHSSLFSQCCLFPGSVCSQAEFTLEVSAWTCSDQHLKQTSFWWNMKLGREGCDLSWLAQKEISSQVAAGKASLDSYHTHTHSHTSLLVHSKVPDNMSFAVCNKKELSSWKFSLQASMQMWEIPQKINVVTNCEGKRILSESF